jgi:signal transduction histidine kinase
MSSAPLAASPSWQDRWQRFSAAFLRGYHAYAGWLVRLSWRRFIVYSVLLLVIVGIVHDMPPFTWRVTEQVQETRPRVVVVPPRPPAPPRAAEAPAPPASTKAPGFPIRIDKPRPGATDEGVEINIGKDGIRITPRAPAAAASSAADAAEAAAAQARRAAEAASAAAQGLRIVVPPGAASDSVREAIEEARLEIEQAMREALEEAEQAARDAAEARRDAEAALAELARDEPRRRTRVTRYGIGDVMMQFTLLWILGSAILKYTYKGRIQAERQAARATETAEAESLKRQVVEARMAAMQAQVEPHFLFNTLASIDHLIETDPGRASQMQKNLIALLRASMPTMREAGGGAGNGVRDLGRELTVIRPYLEILKVRMEERLTTQIEVPDGLLSAEFPPMMIQTLVENAIKHGLEPKAEGGHLLVKAEIVHGKLQVTVADTGLGFGKAATAGTGVGLANIRERLQLLYGAKATLTVAENAPSGTRVTVTVPYRTVDEAVA